jgi:hypothetical protein
VAAEYSTGGQTSARNSRLDMSANVGDGIASAASSFALAQSFDAPKFRYHVIVADRLHS